MASQAVPRAAAERQGQPLAGAVVRPVEPQLAAAEAQVEPRAAAERQAEPLAGAVGRPVEPRLAAAEAQVEPPVVARLAAVAARAWPRVVAELEGPAALRAAGPEALLPAAEVAAPQQAVLPRAAPLSAPPAFSSARLPAWSFAQASSPKRASPFPARVRHPQFPRSPGAT